MRTQQHRGRLVTEIHNSGKLETNNEFIPMFGSPSATSDPGDFVVGAVQKNDTFLNGVSYTFSFDLTTSSTIIYNIGNSATSLSGSYISSSGSYSYTFTGDGLPGTILFMNQEGTTIELDNIKLTYIAPNTVNFLADIRQSTDYSPFGVKLHNRDLTLHPASGAISPYRYAFNGMEKDDELKGSGNSYDFGARMYDSRLGRWLTIDAHSSTYPNQSPYCFAMNSPIIAIDPDGNDVVPTTGFKSSTYYDPYLKLRGNNSIYNEILKKFIPAGSIDFILDYNDKKVGDGARARTYMSGSMQAGKIHILANSYYTDEQTSIDQKVFRNVQGHIIIQYYEETEIAKAKTLLHEAVHAMIYANTHGTVEDDDEHNEFSKYRELIFKGLVEYNTENDLGYSEEDLEALSWKGAHSSDAFKDYIQNRATKNGVSFEVERQKWSDQIDAMTNDVYDQVDLTEKREEESGVWDRGGKLAPPEN